MALSRSIQSFIRHFLFLSLCTISALINGQDKIVINEVMASNQGTVADEDGDFEDWIELYNYGEESINLNGYGLSDDSENPFRWTFANIIVAPDEYLLVWASGKNRIEQPTINNILIGKESDWRYLDDGSNQGLAWRMPGFEDNTWKSGSTMLGYDTKNSTLFGTELSFGDNPDNKHITYYFRNHFEVIDPKKLGDLQLKLFIDDGAVVYMNGIEAIRWNMPDGEISYTTRANVTVSTIDESIHTIPATLLVEGENTIVVELHQHSTTSSDLRFDMEISS
jgi:hypothetical protein